jgi:hypothetical protein
MSLTLAGGPTLDLSGDLSFPMGSEPRSVTTQAKRKGSDLSAFFQKYNPTSISLPDEEPQLAVI